MTEWRLLLISSNNNDITTTLSLFYYNNTPSLGKKMSSSRTQKEETRRRSRIVLNNNDDSSSSDEDDNVISIHSSSSSSSSFMEDFDTLWEQHVAQQTGREPEMALATQPPTTTTSTEINTKLQDNVDNHPPKSLEMSVNTTKQQKEEHEHPPRVSLSPRKHGARQQQQQQAALHQNLKPKSKVTMLEAVVMGAAATGKHVQQSNVVDTTESKDFAKKKQSSTTTNRMEIQNLPPTWQTKTRIPFQNHHPQVSPTSPSRLLIKQSRRICLTPKRSRWKQNRSEPRMTRNLRLLILATK